LQLSLLPASIMTFSIVVVALVANAAAGSDVHVRLLDFPLTGECAEPISLAPPQDTGSSENGCSVLEAISCSAEIIGCTVGCLGPEDLPCIAAALALLGGCGGCVCQLLQYDCPYGVLQQNSLPEVEFGSCSELGFSVPQESLHIDQGGFDVVVQVQSPNVTLDKFHLLDTPEADSCSELSAIDLSKLPVEYTAAAGSCVDAGFPLFDSFGFVPAVPSASDETNGGCGQLHDVCKEEIDADIIGSGTCKKGDKKCIAKCMGNIGCGECVCALLHYQCGGFPVVVFNESSGALTV